jgi:DNA transposition AAA+ family ATPase
MSESSAADADSDLATLREEMRSAMKLRRVNMPSAAMQMADVGYSTLQSFMAGKYKGDNYRLADEVRKWIAMSAAAAERHAVIPARKFVATPTGKVFLATLQHAQLMPDIVTISGGAGVGKTEAAREHARNHANVWIATARPSVSAPHSMLDMLCRVTGVHEATASRRNTAIVRRVTGTQGLLIVDEANHLTTPALDELRSIHDEAEIGLALMGNEEVYSRLEGGGRRAEFAQLFSRVGMRARRGRPLLGDIDALLDAAGIDGAAERKLLRGIATKPGALRGAMKCLAIAQMLAADDEAPIATSHIALAWARLSDNAPVGEAT